VSKFLEDDLKRQRAIRVLSLSTWGPSILNRRRLTKHLDLVEKDDQILLSEADGKASRIVANLSKQELTEVMSERGL
jgi:hypothetical protein